MDIYCCSKLNISEECCISRANCNFTGDVDISDLEMCLVGGEEWNMCLLIVASIVSTVGTFGNILTLASMLYVNTKYPNQFMILQMSVSKLLINLSICDLIYCVFGLPTMIYGQVIGKNPYDRENLFCKFEGTIRNWAAVADFNTMGSIAFFVVMYHHCSRCLEDGGHQNHSNHENRTKIFLVILGIWIVAFVSISPDVFEIVGEYKWTGLRYGCDAEYPHKKDPHKRGQTNWGYSCLVIINVVVMFVSYGIVFYKIWTKRSNTDHPIIEQIELNRDRSHTTMFVVLSLTYSICILPAMMTAWGFWEVTDKAVNSHIKNVTTCVYWCMYMINFMLYVATNERMRAIYKVFLTDLVKKFALQRRISQYSASSSILSPVGKECDVVIGPAIAMEHLEVNSGESISNISDNDATGEDPIMKKEDYKLSEEPLFVLEMDMI